MKVAFDAVVVLHQAFHQVAVHDINPFVAVAVAMPFVVVVVLQ